MFNFLKKKVKSPEDLEIEKKKIENKNLQKVLKKLPARDRKPYLDYINGNILCPMKYSELLSKENKEKLKADLNKEYEEKEESTEIEDFFDSSLGMEESFEEEIPEKEIIDEKKEFEKTRDVELPDANWEEEKPKKIKSKKKK